MTFEIDDLWRQAWASLGIPAPAGALGKLTNLYAEPHRAYHTLDHVADCLRWVSLVGADRPDLLTLALFYHDAVYDARRTDNEAVSAAMAADVLREAGVATTDVDVVVGLVLATDHRRMATTPDELRIVDIDLSILGATPERFDRYNEAIAREYAWVEPAAYAAGRRHVLQSFLDRAVIYRTPPFAACEAQARQNLARALASLPAASDGRGGGA